MATPKYSPHQIGALPFESDLRYTQNQNQYQQQQTQATSTSQQPYQSRFRYHAQPHSQASVQLYDSYFPPHNQQGNIDDIVYRYSAEVDRIAIAAPGTPTVGIYSQDGLWDEEEDPSSSAKQAGPSSKKGITPTVTKSRTGTVYSTTGNTENKNWIWRKPSMPQMNSPTIAMEDQIPLPVPSKGLEKKKSKGLLRGKGRRGELIVAVSNDADESFEAPPPLPIPATPASFITESSPASFSSPTFSPVNYPSPMFQTPALPTPPLTATSTTTNKSSKSTSSWKRGMQKIFKSKSSAALREAATKEASLSPPPMPQMPNLPGPSKHSLGKPFSSSTPPLGESRRIYNPPTPGYLSTPPSAARESFVPPFMANLPNDPFASSLDLTCNNPVSSPLASPKPRPGLRHNSPSLKDLKNLLPSHHKPAMMKAKSFATLHHREGSKSVSKETASQSKLAKRMSSLVGLNIYAHAAPENAETFEPLQRPPTQASLAPPIESPPLLPPQPPYFQGASRSPSLPSITSDSDSSPEESPRLSIPPSAPLPPIPLSSSSSNLAAPIQRSGSGAVLLPRSRSTSMSFKSPPTSSSFFDLYEQLGIWPSAEKEKKEIHDEPEEMAEIRSKAQDKENISPPEEQGENLDHAVDATNEVSGSHLQINMPKSDSLSSTASWNVALDSFPQAPGADVLDFGLPYVADEEGMDSLVESSQHHGDRSDVLSIVAVAASSRNSSHQTTINNSMSTDRRTSGSTVTRATSVGLVNSSFSSKGRGRASGSGNSSRENSPERLRDDLTDREASDNDSSEDDDVPLSRLHPEAAAAQVQRRDTRRKMREARKAHVVQSQKQSAKSQGRNPGGEYVWDGEGGIPADILVKKLEAVMVKRAEREAAFIAEQQGGPSVPLGLRAHRSMREHVPPTLDQSIRRVHSQGHAAHPSPTGWQEEAPPLPLIQTAIPLRQPSGYPHPSSAISPTDTSFGRIPSRGHASNAQSSYPMNGDRSRQNSVATSISSRLPAAPAGTRAPSRQDERSVPTSAQVTRSNTAATQYSMTSSQRARAQTNGSTSLPHKESASLHSRSTTEPLPNSHRPSVPAPAPAQRVHASVPAFVTALNGKKIILDLTTSTTAREVLVNTYHQGDLVDATVGKSWVLCEMFAEMGCERQVREYEQLLPIVKGWDQTAKFNCFVFKQSNRGMPTWSRGVPANPPMLGSWVQYETKKGKWSKRWLETRGGQVFLAKNEKNKEEIHINSLFFDIYTITRGYDSPKPSTFMMKRVEPSSNFEDQSDYAHVFSCEEGLAFKLMAAIYDAKSYTLSQSFPQMTSNQLTTPNTSSGTSSIITPATSRRPNFAHTNSHDGPTSNQQPLVSLNNEEQKRSGFTGRGLLKI
ncbi:uncharacterized protein IL334_002028 [Kwoniella shivajii]|uniref:PH domain-containing protein n=1 Tax=Kwoniella shivajii TaxID=564305 RepID=A0ABZ1CTU2_9TREE|nr:hypothetical protein IL334_002028 [Kwoniella shivajii]